MTLNQFSTSLFIEMKKRLEEISSTESNTLQALKNKIAVVLQYIAKLKIFFNDYEIDNKPEEIQFFKIIKPKFLSELFYYQKSLELQSRLPLGSVTEIKNYYLNEFAKINNYLNNNNELYTYYRSNSTLLDEIYFTRKEPDSWLLLNFENYETDLSFTTIYDHKLSKIIALELMSDLIKESITKLENSRALIDPAENKTKLIWTGSKVSLIELMYALQSTGSFNNGVTDIKQLASKLEEFFSVDLGNYYRVFQEIRIRKINRTTFLDQLKIRLIQRMDTADENLKSK